MAAGRPPLAIVEKPPLVPRAAFGATQRLLYGRDRRLGKGFGFLVRTYYQKTLIAVRPFAERVRPRICPRDPDLDAASFVQMNE